MARLIAFEQANTLAQTRHNIIPLQHVIVGVIASFRQYALDNHIVRNACTYLSLWRLVSQEEIHSVGQFFIEQLAIAGGVIMGKITVLLGHFVQETPEKLQVLGLFPEKGGQEHFFLKALLTG